MKEVIDRLIKEQMEHCAEYDRDLCDSVMCSDCGMLNKLLRQEYAKTYDVCLQCSGLGGYSTTRIASFAVITSTTLKCNLCGGTGRYLSEL